MISATGKGVGRETSHWQMICASREGCRRGLVGSLDFFRPIEFSMGTEYQHVGSYRRETAINRAPIKTKLWVGYTG